MPEPPYDAGVERTPQVQLATRRYVRDVAIPSAAACAVRMVDGKLPDFTLEPGRPLVLAMAVRSQFKDPGYLEAVTRRVRQATPDDIAAVRTRHLGWWREFWGRSTVELDDPVIEQRYYLSHYVMGSCSRDPKFPPDIFGWVTTDRPEWQGDYHLNYNHMAPFYGLYSSNRLEQALPYHAPLLDFLERGRFYARSVLGIRGVYFPVGIGPLGLETNRGHRGAPAADRRSRPARGGRRLLHGPEEQRRLCAGERGHALVCHLRSGLWPRSSIRWSSRWPTSGRTT